MYLDQSENIAQDRTRYTSMQTPRQAQKTKTLANYRQIGVVLLLILAQISPILVFAKESRRKLSITVPFMVQAPTANWDEPFQNTCEETAALMVGFWANSEAIPSQKNKQETLLKDLVEWENKKFGSYIDTDTEQTSTILIEYFKAPQVEIVSKPDVTMIKNVLLNNGLVIVPTSGRALGNKYFRGEGPLYHMLVIKGFDDKKKEFITNDPGTKRGYGFRYKYDIIINAIADWDHTIDTVNPETPKMIVVYKSDSSKLSLQEDEDNPFSFSSLLSLFDL